jgi:AcrR family transcriptional regulator
MGLREEKKQEQRAAILGVALELFRAQGFEATRVQDVTERLRISEGTFFNYFPSKDHILIAFGEMQLGKLEAAIENARRANMAIGDLLRSLGGRMTEEPTRNPAIVRTLLQAYLSTTPVRAAMVVLQKRAHSLHTQIAELGQDRGEIRKDLPASELAHVFRQTIFGTLLIWSLHGDASLPSRIETAFHVLWTGLSPREVSAAPQNSSAVSGE